MVHFPSSSQFGAGMPETFWVEKKLLPSSRMLEHNVAHRSYPSSGERASITFHSRKECWSLRWL
jgi:hypothetical protein